MCRSLKAYAEARNRNEVDPFRLFLSLSVLECKCKQLCMSVVDLQGLLGFSSLAHIDGG